VEHLLENPGLSLYHFEFKVFELSDEIALHKLYIHERNYCTIIRTITNSLINRTESNGRDINSRGLSLHYHVIFR
jgi:uncharacterized OsmC-like protein